MRIRIRWTAAALIVSAMVATSSVEAQAPTVTVGGVAYAQYQYQLRDTANHVNNFDVTRAYINVIGKFAYGIGTRVTADIFRSTDGSLSYRLKYAYATWNPEGSALTWKLGQMHTPLLDWEEHLWDYRMQGQMALERGGYMSSSDFGFGVDGNWGFDKVNMQLGVYNGENYNRAPGDQRKDLMGRVSVRLVGSDEGGRDGGLRLTGYSQVGKPTGGGTRERYMGMLSYRSKALVLAAEYATTTDSTGAIGTTAATKYIKGTVTSLFGVFKIPSTKLSLIARVDITDANTDATKDATTKLADDKSTRLIAGVSYTISSNLRLLADLDHLSYQNDANSTAKDATRSQALFQIQLSF